MPLKYLFTAEYTDGTIYQQTPEDVSVSDPKKSCFSDIDHRKLVKFTLKGEGHSYAVNLRDGHFEVDGVQFFMHEDFDLVAFRLIFFRQHTHTIQQTRFADKELSHEIVYRMGWQTTTVRGENYQRIMQIK